MFFNKATIDFYKQYNLCHTGLLLYISRERYFTEYINAHIFLQLYEYMAELVIELYKNIFLPYHL